MKALINKNFLYMKRNLCSSLAILFIPIIFSLSASIFVRFLKKSQNNPSVEKYLNASYLSSFNPFSMSTIEKQYFKTIGIISLQNTSSFEQLADQKQLCNEQCNFQHFESLEDFTAKMKDYEGDSITLVFHFNKEDNGKEIIKVQVNNDEVWHENIYTSINLLSITPSNIKPNLA